MRPERTLEADRSCSLRTADFERRIRALADRVRQLRGWRAFLAAFVSGGVSMLAMAPTHLSPVLFVTLPVLLWLTEGALSSAGARKPAWRRAAVVGWWYAFGFHLIGLYWIGKAFLVEADVFAWLLPFAVTLLPAGLALFHAAGLAAAARAGLFRGPVTARLMALALALSASDWLRGHLLTGFPWNVLGYALTWPLVLMQSAGLVGVYGLTLLAAVVFTAPLTLLAAAEQPRGPLSHRLQASTIVLVPLAVLLAWGAWRLSTPLPPDVQGVAMRLVQPSIPQHEKWRPERQREFFEQHLALSASAPDGRTDGLQGITHLIWSEAAMPFMPLDYPDVLNRIGALLPDRALLLAGILRLERRDGTRLAYNSLAVFDAKGQPVGLYDKIHLVPFGEYLPFQQTLEAIGLEQVTRMRGGFSTGPMPRPLLAASGLPPLSVLICYEAVFPGAVIQGQSRPGALLNVTNDGWFGATAGPYQHFHQARLRAVEEGLPLVRVSNNGISAVVDPYGAVRASLPLNSIGVIDSPLPGIASAPPYAWLGDLPFAIAWAAFLAWAFTMNTDQQ